MTRRPRQPERLNHANQRDLSDPFSIYLRRYGTCAICRERDESRHHGAAHCRGNFRRQHPTCTHDGRKPRFAPDLAAIRSIGATP